MLAATERTGKLVENIGGKKREKHSMSLPKHLAN